MPKDRFRANIRKDQGFESRCDEGEGTWQARRVGNHVQNERDRAWLEGMLMRPELAVLPSYYRTMLEQSITWLREVPTRTLGESWQRESRFRKVYDRLQMLLRKVADGTHVPPTEEQRAAARRKQRLYEIRKAETRPKRPEWMTDPNLLPKRPPGRKDP